MLVGCGWLPLEIKIMAKASIPSDIEIAQAASPKLIGEIAKQAGLQEEDYEGYGRYIAKLTREKCIALQQDSSDTGKLILVTAMSPTPAGEGKTTTSVNLAACLSMKDSDSLAR